MISQKIGPHRITNRTANSRQRTATATSPHRITRSLNTHQTYHNIPQPYRNIIIKFTATHCNTRQPPTTSQPRHNLNAIYCTRAATAIHELRSTIIQCNVIILCYHLADIMSRASLLYGKQALLDEYNQYVAEKLNVTFSETGRKSNTTLGFARGMQQMMEDVDTYNPYHSYLDYTVL